MILNIDIENKSTKDVILEYLKMNRGREIAVREISVKFDFKLNRISNAIKELELAGDIVIDRRPLKKGKYTVIRLTGDTITKFATHEKEINPKNGNKIIEDYENDNFSLEELVELLNSVDYTQSKLKKVLDPYFDNYYSLVTEFIQPVMYLVGVLWETGKLTVAEEHLISARIEKYLIDLIGNEPKRSNKIIILSPVENENHTLVLLSLELLLVEKGLNVINLSRTLSIFSIMDFIKKMKIKPEYVFFSITMSSFTNNLKMDIRLIHDELPMKGLKIVIGGQGIKNTDISEFDGVYKLIKTNEELLDLLNLL